MKCGPSAITTDTRWLVSRDHVHSQLDSNWLENNVTSCEKEHREAVIHEVLLRKRTFCALFGLENRDPVRQPLRDLGQISILTPICGGNQSSEASWKSRSCEASSLLILLSVYYIGHRCWFTDKLCAFLFMMGILIATRVFIRKASKSGTTFLFPSDPKQYDPAAWWARDHQLKLPYETSYWENLPFPNLVSYLQCIRKYKTPEELCTVQTMSCEQNWSEHIYKVFEDAFWSWYATYAGWSNVTWQKAGRLYSYELRIAIPWPTY